MTGEEKAFKDFTKKLVHLSLDAEGQPSEERVEGVLQALQNRAPRQRRAILKYYLFSMRQEIRKNQAVVEYVESVPSPTIESIKDFLSSRYRRAISVATRENSDLIAGLRIRVADDVYEASIAERLQTLAQAIK